MLTIEGSPCGDNCEGGAVNLSQLNLIDLAGFESSKAETTGVRQKEGSYINKSLLTLGTIFSEEHLGKQNCDEQDINADFFCSDGSACSCESVVAAAGSNNALVASASNDYSIQVWRLPDGFPISVLRGHIGAVTAIAFSPRPSSMYQLLSYVQLLIYFMLKYAMEVLLSEYSVITTYYFHWSTSKVALFLACLGLTVLPVNIVVGSYISNMFEDRQILLASEIMVCIGILLSFHIVIPYSVPQYVCSGLIMFVFAEVLEGRGYQKQVCRKGIVPDYDLRQRLHRV
ncbi:unnamed protein product [Camellia sinensis]